MRVAYLINQYPKVSHTFIRREIAALEGLGATVSRFALRGWDAELKDPLDEAERGRTHYVLQGGLVPLLLATLACAVRAPVRGWRALRLAIGMARRSDRSWVHHLAYLAEACWLVPRLRSAGASHLHAHFGTNPAEVAMLTHVLCGLPYSFTVHGPEEFDQAESLGLATKLARASFVVAVSSFGRSQLWRWAAPAHWGKVQVVHCGLGADLISAPVTPTPNVQRLVCVGRLCEQKGQLLLLDALHRYRQLHGEAFELVLAGDGEMRPQVEAAITRLDLSGHVRITGWLGSEDVMRELRSARALVLPSFAEGLPVVIMEALAVGRPVITTFVAGIPELVRHSHEGWLVPAGCVESLVSAMRECLTAPAKVLQDMQESARQRARVRHDVDVEAAKLMALFTPASGLAVAP